jgi:outer membrane protein OmpA-like peptidoglycan-associated protein
MKMSKNISSFITLLSVILISGILNLAVAHQDPIIKTQDAGDRQNDVYFPPLPGPSGAIQQTSYCCPTLASAYRVEPPMIRHFIRMSLDADTHFDFDKSTLKPAGIAALNQLLGRIAALDPGYGMGRIGYVLGIDAVGHTDWIGSHRYNDGLGMRRANSVKRYLMSLGVPGAIVNVHSLGEIQPIADNRSSEGRALNRRVEVVVHTASLP